MCFYNICIGWPCPLAYVINRTELSFAKDQHDICGKMLKDCCKWILKQKKWHGQTIGVTLFSAFNDHVSYFPGHSSPHQWCKEMQLLCDRKCQCEGEMAVWFFDRKTRADEWKEHSDSKQPGRLWGWSCLLLVLLLCLLTRGCFINVCKSSRS